MSNDYICRQDAMDDLGVTKNATKYGGDHSGYDTKMIYEIHDVLTGLPSANVVPVEILKAEIYKLKCQQDSKNQDYYTGYMSALSTVEGILAEMGEE